MLFDMTKHSACTIFLVSDMSWEYKGCFNMLNDVCHFDN